MIRERPDGGRGPDLHRKASFETSGLWQARLADARLRRELASARLRAGLGAFAFKAESNARDDSAIPALDGDDEHGSGEGDYASAELAASLAL